MASTNIAPKFDMTPAMQQLCGMHGTCPSDRITSYSSSALSSSSNLYALSNSSSKEATDSILPSLNWGRVTSEGYEKIVDLFWEIIYDNRVSTEDKRNVIRPAIEEATKFNRGYGWLNKQLKAESSQAQKIKDAYEKFRSRPTPCGCAAKPLYQVTSHSSHALSSSSSLRPLSNSSSKDPTDPLLSSLNSSRVTPEGYEKIVDLFWEVLYDNRVLTEDKRNVVRPAIEEAKKFNRGYGWLNKELKTESSQAQKIKDAYEKFRSRPTPCGSPAERSISAAPKALSQMGAAANALGDPDHLFEPRDLDPLLARLYQILKEGRLSEAYRQNLVEPFVARLETYKISYPVFLNNQLDEQTLRANGDECPVARIAQSILQNFDTELQSRELARSTRAVAEVIDNIFQTFLTDQCAKGPRSHCQRLPSPLPNWYDQGLSTYSHGIPGFGSSVSIVNLPITYAKQSALAWGCIGHEVAGHDILAVQTNALSELQGIIIKELEKSQLGNTWPQWEKWLEEAASDVLNVLNTGPAAAFSIVAVLRALSANAYHFKLNPTHSCWKNSSGQLECDAHPIDLVRGHIALYSLEELHKKTQFDLNGIYAKAIKREVERDLPGLNPSAPVKNTQASLAQFQASAGIVVAAIMNTRLKALGGRSFSEIRAWNKEDEKQVKELREEYYSDSGVWASCAKVDRMCQSFDQLVAKQLNGRSAPHLVSAAVLESICPTPSNSLDEKRLQTLFGRMIYFLELLHLERRGLPSAARQQPLNSSYDEYECKGCRAG